MSAPIIGQMSFQQTLFEMFFLQPVLGGHSVFSGHLAIPRG